MLVITRWYMVSNVWLSLSDLHRPRRIATAQNATMATTSSAVTARSDGIRWPPVALQRWRWLNWTRNIQKYSEISRNIRKYPEIFSVSQDGRYKNRYKNTHWQFKWEFLMSQVFFGPGFSLNCQRCPRMVWKLVDFGRFAGQTLDGYQAVLESLAVNGDMNQTSKNLFFFAGHLRLAWIDRLNYNKLGLWMFMVDIWYI